MYTLSVTFAVGTQATGVSSMCVFFKESFSPMSIKSPKLSATRQVINYLVAGRSLTSAQARTKFGVKSMPKMMDCIANLLESQGNWEVTKSDTGVFVSTLATKCREKCRETCRSLRHVGVLCRNY